MLSGISLRRKDIFCKTPERIRILRRTSPKSERTIRPSYRTRRNGRSITTKAYSLIFFPVIGFRPASWRKPFNTLPVRSTCYTAADIPAARAERLAKSRGLCLKRRKKNTLCGVSVQRRKSAAGTGMNPCNMCFQAPSGAAASIIPQTYSRT